MKAPTTLLDRPGRVVGAVVALSATTMMALVAGTASASEPGRCVENVNVRAEPSTSSRIVALCEAGTEVKVGESRNGFVRLTDLGGWSAQEFVSVNGAEPAAPADTADSSTAPASSGDDTTGGDAPAGADDSAAPSSAADDATGAADPSRRAGDARGSSGSDSAGRVAPRSTPAPEPESSPVGGLLG